MTDLPWWWLILPATPEDYHPIGPVEIAKLSAIKYQITLGNPEDFLVDPKDRQHTRTLLRSCERRHRSLLEEGQ